MRRNIADTKPLVIEKIKKSLPSHCKFVSFVEPYTNSRGKVILSCSSHGEWSAAIRHITTGASGCPACGRLSTSMKKSQDLSIVSSKIEQKCKEYDYTFLGFSGNYKNRKSKIRIECRIHGKYLVNINNFIDNERKCPGCKLTGFNPSKPGHLYALRSHCGSFVKVGISNKPKVRFYQLRRMTPFDFEVIENLRFENGNHAMQMEKVFHNNFQPANLSGFDGCTEWLKWQPEIQTWFRFL